MAYNGDLSGFTASGELIAANLPIAVNSGLHQPPAFITHSEINYYPELAGSTNSPVKSERLCRH